MGLRTTLLAYVAVPLAAAALVAGLSYVALFGVPSDGAATARADGLGPIRPAAAVGQDRLGTVAKDCGADGRRRLVYAGPAQLWPADRARREAPVSAIDDGGGGVRLTTSATSGTGSEQLDEARPGRAATVHVLRPKRDGLVYTITASARFADGSTCQARFSARVARPAA